MTPPPVRDATTLLTLDQALAAMAAAVERIGDVERLPLLLADGRVLAAALVSPLDLPPFDNAAVDGFAAAHADLAAARPLPVASRIAAGDAATSPLGRGTAARLFTGAAIPPGADTVAMQEDVAMRGDRVLFPPGLKRGANLRKRGEDVALGAVALPGGRRLRPQDLALAAGLGVDALVVVRRPRVALFSTGDEIVEAGVSLGIAKRHDSNRVMLAALAARAGAEVTDLGILPDRPDAIAAALATADAGHDLILTSGGVSVGEEDHVKSAVAERGAVAIWRLAIKPGRPVVFGRAGRALFAGLPGNPVSAFVTFTRIVRPLLAGLSGETLDPVGFPVNAGFSHRKRSGLREYVRATLRPEGAVSWADKAGTEGAANLTSLTAAGGLVEIGEDVEQVSPGDTVAFLPFAALF